MAESLEELQAKLDRLTLARKHHGMEPTTKAEFTKLIRSTRAKIKRLQLPKSHKPASLVDVVIEPRKEVVYAAGYEEKPGSFGMFYGPSTSLSAILDAVPCEANPCIIRFNLDGSDEVLYRWNDASCSWKLQ